VLSFSHPIRLVAAAAAVLALAAPAAQARPADLAARHQQMLFDGSVAADTARPGGHQLATTRRDEAVLGAPVQVAGPFVLHPAVQSPQLPPDRIDRIGIRSHGTPVIKTAPVVHSTGDAGNGFDWNAAVIGAGSMLGLAFLAGAAMGLRGRRRVAIS
jgi:hypothetical protein